jgi:excinuclease ABC subunit C
MSLDKEKLYKDFPDQPGVYVMKNKSGDILYVGKAGSLIRRVSSYFHKSHNKRIEKLVQEISKIDYKVAGSSLEALILEAELIKKYRPPYNVKEKDDKSFLFIEISNDELPQVSLVRGKSKVNGERFGPYTSASDLRNAMKILRKIFPYSIHNPKKYGKFKRPCLDAQIGLCSGTCDGSVNKEKYLRDIKSLKKILSGNIKDLIKDLENKMSLASKNEEFEKANIFKKQIFSLNHLNDVSLISESFNDFEDREGLRIEGYDISNISGDSAVGSMVVFENNIPNKSEYKKFKIKTIKKQNDVGMLAEVLDRRFDHDDWVLPDLVLVDGGKGQVNICKEVLKNKGLNIPVIGIAKGPKRDKNEFFGDLSGDIDKGVLIKVRNEAHRFAIDYHKKIRGSNFLK